jgi:hypothetical protein
MNTTRHHSRWWSGGLILGSLLIPALLTAARADQPPPPPTADQDYAEEPGVQVQTRGPIHEAFAEPTEVKPQPGPIVPKKPPEAIPEQPPDQKPEGENVLWIPGYWSWDTDQQDFLWVSGFWRVAPPDRRWVPGYWTEVEGGWQWVPGFWAAASQEDVQYLPAPPASVDNGPSTPAPEEDTFYVPGNWVYRTTGYVWSPGFWSAMRPGWIWQPACYYWTPSGYVFVNGYWDYPLETRGVLFAPVCFSRPLWLTPGWFYRPRFVVGVNALLNCFWARPSWCSYYFGDFYGPTYARLGFSPWCTWGPRFNGPLFSYYSWVNRGNPLWARNLRDTFWGRFDGELARPPRTLAAQRTLVQASARSGTVINQNVNNIRIVTRFNATNFTRARLATVNQAELRQHQLTTQRLHELRQERSRFEPRMARTHPGELRAAREQHFQLPRAAQLGRPAARLEPRSEPGRLRESPAGRTQPERRELRGNPPVTREHPPSIWGGERRVEPRQAPHVPPPARREGSVTHHAPPAHVQAPAHRPQAPAVHRTPAPRPSAPARHTAPQHHAPPPPPPHNGGNHSKHK